MPPCVKNCIVLGQPSTVGITCTCRRASISTGHHATIPQTPTYFQVTCVKFSKEHGPALVTPRHFGSEVIPSTPVRLWRHTQPGSSLCLKRCLVLHKSTGSPGESAHSHNAGAEPACSSNGEVSSDSVEQHAVDIEISGEFATTISIDRSCDQGVRVSPSIPFCAPGQLKLTDNRWSNQTRFTHWAS